MRREDRCSSGGEDLDRSPGSDRDYDDFHAGVRISEDHDRDLRDGDPDRHRTFCMGKSQTGGCPRTGAAAAIGASDAISDSQLRQRALCPGLYLFPAIRLRNLHERMESLARI